jgi:hypothetical protein
MQAPDEIQDLCRAFLDGLKTALGEKLCGVYIYGAWAFPEAAPTGDIDFHVILSERLSDGEKAAVRDLHAGLARDFPPLGAELDGYYLLLEDARQTAPPAHQLLAGVIDDSWALHREHIRAGRRIVLHGPDPRQVYPAATWAELVQALQGELDHVEQHLTEYPAFCVLNLCRLIYSFSTRDVVASKWGSAAWAEKTFPQWRPLIEAARRSYESRTTGREDEHLQSEVSRFFRFACERIREGSAGASE